jgi:hypothetical protein
MSRFCGTDGASDSVRPVLSRTDLLKTIAGQAVGTFENVWPFSESRRGRPISVKPLDPQMGTTRISRVASES